MPDTTPLHRLWPRYGMRAARWALRALAALVLALGLVWSALHFVIVPRIDVLRPWLLDQVQQRSGLHLEMDAIEVTSNGWVPELALRGVRLLDAQGATALALPEVTVAVSSASLLLGDVEQITLQGADLEIRRDPQGRIWIAGVLVQSSDNRDNAALDWLLGQRELLVGGGRVRWVDAMGGAAPLEWNDVRLRVRNSARTHALDLQATPPASWGEPLRLRGQFSRPLLSAHPGRFGDWRGQTELAWPRVDLAALAPYVDAAKGIHSGRGALNVRLEVQAGTFTSATADLSLEDLDASLDAGQGANLGAQGQALQMRQLAGQIALNRLDGDGVQYAVKGLQGQTRDGLRWPASDLTLQLWGKDAARGAHGSLSVGQLDIAWLAQLAGRMPLAAPIQNALAGLRPQGQIQAVTLQWQGLWDAPTDYRVQARLQQAGAAPYAAAGFPGVGVEGLDAEIDATPSGGTAKWSIKKGALTLPTWLEEGRVALDSADASLRWSWVDGGLRLEMPRLQFANADLAGDLAVAWNAPRAAAGGLGVIALDGKLTRLLPARLPRYLPMSMDRDVRNYLRDAFSGGELGPVSVKVKGDVDQFPFSNGRAGVFQIAAAVSNINYAYAVAPKQKGAPTWPTLSQLSGDVALDRDTLTLNNARANWVHPGSPGAVVPITRGTARVTQLYDHAAITLNLEGRSNMADALAVVNRSAVGALMGNVLARTTASGAGAYKVNLQIPLAEPAKTTLQGSLLLAGSDFQYSPDTPRLARVRGTLGFTENSLSLGGLEASALGGDMRLDGALLFSDAAWEGGKNRVRVQGTLTSQGLRESKDLGAWAAASALLEGQTTYSAEWGWRAGAAQIQISSDLQGMALALPAPLGKSAPTAMPVRLDWASGGSDPAPKAPPRNETIRMSLGRVAQVVLQRDTSGAQARLLRGTVALGEAGDTASAASAAPSLPAQGLLLQIDTAVLDVDQWAQVLNQLNPAADAKSGGESAYAPTAFKLRAQQLLWGGRQWDRLTASGRREGAVWRMDVDGAQLAGKLEFGPANTGPGASTTTSASAGSRLSARLSRLSLEASTANDVQNLLDAPATTLPALDVVVDALEMYGKKLGRMQATAVNVGSGPARAEWRLQQLQLTVPEATFSASGVWGAVSSAAAPAPSSGSQASARKVSADTRRTELSFKLDIADAGALLARLGMANVVRAGSGKVEGTMGWAGAPLNLDYPTLSGRLNLDIAKGQFLRADPGAARLLGILSLQSLPRRLLLDFRDVFNDGFEFNYVRGDVVTEQGTARSDNLQMKGPLATVLMDGSTDIARESQRIKVLVVPELDTGAATLLTALANPIAGLYALVASTLLRQPFQDASTQELLVEGTWQAPKVSKMDRRTGKPIP